MRFITDVVHERRADVLVIGGGPAGIAAAIASARTGASTFLVEQQGFLGGAATASLVGPFMSCLSLDGTTKVIDGIFGEVVDRMVSIGGALPSGETGAGKGYSSFITMSHHGVTSFEPYALKIVADQLVQEAEVKILLHSTFLQPIIEAGELRGAIIATKSGLMALYAKVTVDTTGDADVAFRAGAEMVKGREKDGLMQPATLFFRVGNVNDTIVEENGKHYADGTLFRDYIDKARGVGDFKIPRDRIGIYKTPTQGIWRVNTTRVLGVDGTSVDDLTRAEIEGRQQVIQLMRFFRKYLPGFENAILIGIAPNIGVRETRRIIGEYVLTEQDLVTGKLFDDSIACCGYEIDIHSLIGDGSRDEAVANIYSIPYRSLVPKTLDNLLVAGRCLSATHVASSATRVMPPCFATGQAAGTAAALASRESILPREVVPDILRATLKGAGAILPEDIS